jgi:hypothetical protein
MCFFEHKTNKLQDPWSIEDVQNIRPDLDDDQSVDVLISVANAFDANNGINWYVLEYHAEQLFPEPEVINYG